MRYWHPFSLEAAQAGQGVWDPDEILLLPLYPHYLDHDDRQQPDRMARDGGPSRSGQADDDAVLLPFRFRLLGGDDDDRAAQLTQRRGRQVGAGDRPACAVLGARVAGDHHQKRRSLPVPDGAHGGGRWCGYWTCRGPRLDALLPIAGDAAEVDRALAPRRRSSGRSTTRWRCWWCQSPSCRSIPRRWSNSTSSIANWRRRLGIAGYFRAPTQNSDPAFIDALAELTEAALGRGPGLCSFVGGRTCPKQFGDCPHARAGVSPNLAPVVGAAA